MGEGVAKMEIHFSLYSKKDVMIDIKGNINVDHIAFSPPGVNTPFLFSILNCKQSLSMAVWCDRIMQC